MPSAEHAQIPKVKSPARSRDAVFLILVNFIFLNNHGPQAVFSFPNISWVRKNIIKVGYFSVNMKLIINFTKSLRG
jgi:hypothetical protein